MLALALAVILVGMALAACAVFWELIVERLP